MFLYRCLVFRFGRVYFCDVFFFSFRRFGFKFCYRFCVVLVKTLVFFGFRFFFFEDGIRFFVLFVGRVVKNNFGRCRYRVWVDVDIGCGFGGSFYFLGGGERNVDFFFGV